MRLPSPPRLDTPLLDIRKIRYFVAVYEAGSITKAAEREHIAQPALTVHIQQIEEEFKVKLFERSAQGVSPTPAGEHLYRLCLELSQRIGSLGEQMAQFTGNVAGSISAGIMPSICQGALAPMLARYTSAYPNVQVRVVEGLSGTLAQWVLAGEVDFAICNRSASTRGLEHRLLLRDQLLLVSGRECRLKPFAACRLDALTELKLVLPSRHHTLRHVLDAHIDDGDFKPAVSLEIDGLSATLQFVAHSNWSTILPRITMINEFATGRFIMNPVEAPLAPTEIYELRPARHTLSVAAQRFISMLEEDLRNAPALPTAQETH